MWCKMEVFELAKKLEGLQTIGSIAHSLSVNRRTAINYVSVLRKKGFAETIYGKRKIRMYRISPLKVLRSGCIGFYEFLNQNSKIKIYAPYLHRIYGHKMSAEEAIVKSIKTGEFRVILSSLALFNKIKDWSYLSRLARNENVGRQVGALYDTARIVMKTKKIDKRTRKALLKDKIKDKFIVKNARTKDLNYIEKIWKVYLPFNKADLEAYKEWLASKNR